MDSVGFTTEVAFYLDGVKSSICHRKEIMNCRVVASLFLFYRLYLIHAATFNTESSVNVVRFAEDLRRWTIYPNLRGKMVLFSENKFQFLRFDAELDDLLDFSMCVWFRPNVKTAEHYLFTYSHSSDNGNSSIVWKIIMKDGKPHIKLQILGMSIMEEKMEIVPIGFWYHICTQWQGSTGFWAVFINSQVFSLGYHSQRERRNWNVHNGGRGYIGNGDDSGSSINGDIYGFYLIALELNFSKIDHPNHVRSFGTTNSDSRSRPKTNSSSGFLKSVANDNKSRLSNVVIRRKPFKAVATKRDISDTATTIDANENNPFPRVGRFLAFVKRMFTFVVFPMFKLLRNTWQQQQQQHHQRNTLINSPESATDIITDFRDTISFTTKTTTTTTTSSFNNNNGRLESPTTMMLTDSIDVFDDNDASLSQRTSRGTDGIVTTTEPSEECVKFNEDELSEFVRRLLSSATTPAAQNSLKKFVLAIDFAKKRYLCCDYHQPNNSKAISWDLTAVTLIKNTTISEVARCVHF